MPQKLTIILKAPVSAVERMTVRSLASAYIVGKSSLIAAIRAA
jgi:hypothetical protein